MTPDQLLLAFFWCVAFPALIGGFFYAWLRWCDTRRIK